MICDIILPTETQNTLYDRHTWGQRDRRTPFTLLSCEHCAISQNPSQLPGVDSNNAVLRQGYPGHTYHCALHEMSPICPRVWILNPQLDMLVQKVVKLLRLEPCRRKWITRSRPWGLVWPCILPALFFLTTDPMLISYPMVLTPPLLPWQTVSPWTLRQHRD